MNIEVNMNQGKGANREKKTLEPSGRVFSGMIFGFKEINRKRGNRE